MRKTAESTLQESDSKTKLPTGLAKAQRNIKEMKQTLLSNYQILND